MAREWWFHFFYVSPYGYGVGCHGWMVHRWLDLNKANFGPLGMILHCWSHVLLCWGLCLIVDSVVPVQWMPNCFFHYKSGCYKWVDCLIVIISTCYFQQQQSVCHLPDQVFVQFLTVPCYLLAGSWMQNWGRVLSNKRPRFSILMPCLRY